MGFLAVALFLVGLLILDKDDKAQKAVAYEHFHMRLEAQIIRFENPQGIDYRGEPCGGQFTPRQCNTIVSAFIDADHVHVKPFHHGAFTNGQNEWVDYKVLSTHPDDNDPHIDQIISSDICGKAVEKAVVRVRMFERDATGEYGINDFTCEAPLHTVTPHPVWSPVQLCQPIYQPEKMRLHFRYRVLPLQQEECRQGSHQNV